MSPLHVKAGNVITCLQKGQFLLSLSQQIKLQLALTAWILHIQKLHLWEELIHHVSDILCFPGHFDAQTFGAAYS